MTYVGLPESPAPSEAGEAAEEQSAEITDETEASEEGGADTAQVQPETGEPEKGKQRVRMVMTSTNQESDTQESKLLN